MAVAAYASLVSLTHVLGNVHYRAQCHRLHVDILKIEILQDGVHFLLDFVEAHSLLEGEKIRGLWRQISEVAFEAEQTFDSHVVNQLLSKFEGEQSGSDIILAFSADIDRLIQKIDFIKEELSIVKAEGGDALAEKLSIITEPSGVSLPTALDGQDTTTLVGFDEHVIRVSDRLTSDESKLQIIPIVGMGGIGKTTLTRHVYDKSYIVDHFGKRFWLTISPNYSVQNILQGLLGVSKESQKSLAELGTELHKTLYGRRYLIVMDDMWTSEPCYDLMRYFPDNGNGSRIMLTTRLLDVATCLGCPDPYFINFLNEDQSWSLLCQTTFSQDCCPHPELENIGKDIAKSCKGLPLAIIVIGRQLARSNMTRQYWKFVRENIYSFVNLGDEDHCSKILSLSYNNLPIYLKPCFLYFSVFPEDFKIDVWYLTRSWIAEGLIKQIGDKSQEDFAEEYVKDLINRNLVFVHEKSIDGEVSSCGIHDLFRELCLRESDNEGFLFTPRIQSLSAGSEIYFCCLCALPITNKEVMDVPETAIIPSSTSEVSIQICDACRTRYSHIKRLKLVRVMDVEQEFDIDCQFVHPTSVRYVVTHCHEEEHLNLVNASMLSVLWNLQTLIIKFYGRDHDDIVVLPPEIWDMPQLRHLDVQYGVLPHPVVDVEGNHTMIMKNLLSLAIHMNSISEDVIARIQSLRSLELRCAYFGGECHHCSLLNNDGSLTNLVQLHKLQALTVRMRKVENISFPNSLTELTLCCLEKPSEMLAIIGLLPNLEALALHKMENWVEWRPIEGQFLRLKVLVIQLCGLKYWEVDQTHFPNLEWLYLSSCFKLEEISLAIGDIATLRSIEVYWCFTSSAVEWAKQLWEEQQSYGNESLRIKVTDGEGDIHIFGGGYFGSAGYSQAPVLS